MRLLEDGGFEPDELMQTHVIPRPESQVTSEIVLEDLPPIRIRLAITAHTSTDGTGPVIARGTTDVDVKLSDAVDASVELFKNTVARVEISPLSVSLQVGRTQLLTAKAFDDQNVEVGVEPSEWQWDFAPAGVVSIQPNGASATITGLANGSARVFLTFLPEDVGVSIPVTVSTSTLPNPVFRVIVDGTSQQDSIPVELTSSSASALAGPDELTVQGTSTNSSGSTSSDAVSSGRMLIEAPGKLGQQGTAVLRMAVDFDYSFVDAGSLLLGATAAIFSLGANVNGTSASAANTAVLDRFFGRVVVNRQIPASPSMRFGFTYGTSFPISLSVGATLFNKLSANGHLTVRPASIQIEGGAPEGVVVTSPSFGPLPLTP